MSIVVSLAVGFRLMSCTVRSNGSFEVELVSEHVIVTSSKTVSVFGCSTTPKSGVYVRRPVPSPRSVKMAFSGGRSEAVSRRSVAGESTSVQVTSRRNSAFSCVVWLGIASIAGGSSTGATSTVTVAVSQR